VVEAPYIIDKIVPALPWIPGGAQRTFDTVLLILGKTLNLLLFNSTLLYLSMACHLQGFQINTNLIDQHLENSERVRPANLKPVIHLFVQSLGEGNSSIEPLNAIMVLGFLLSFSGIGANLVRNDNWSVALLTPLLIVVLQFYFFLLPPAYITRCWERVLEKLLTLHALAPTPEQELGSILLYLNTAKVGYHVTNIRVDVSRILYLTFIIVVLLGIHVEGAFQFLDNLANSYSEL